MQQSKFIEIVILNTSYLPIVKLPRVKNHVSLIAKAWHCYQTLPGSITQELPAKRQFWDDFIRNFIASQQARTCQGSLPKQYVLEQIIGLVSFRKIVYINIKMNFVIACVGLDIPVHAQLENMAIDTLACSKMAENLPLGGFNIIMRV